MPAEGRVHRVHENGEVIVDAVETGRHVRLLCECDPVMGSQTDIKPGDRVLLRILEAGRGLIYWRGEDETDPIDGRGLREHLIRTGAIVPRPHGPSRLPWIAYMPTLHLDEDGRRAAAKRVAEGGVDRSLDTRVRWKAQ